MQGDETFNEHLTRLLRDPEFAREWAIQRPLGNLELNVWSLRETKGMTQRQLAEAAGMKQPRVTEIERGNANPTLLTISRIAVALGVTADRLLAEPDEAVLAQARAIADARYTSRPRRERTAKAERASPVRPAPRAQGRRRTA